MINLPSHPQSIGDLIRTGWRLYASSFSQLLPLILLLSVFQLINYHLPIGPSLIAAVLGWVIKLNMLVFLYLNASGQPTTLRAAWQHLRSKVLTCLGTGIIVLFAVMLGIALIIPGIYLAIVLQFYACNILFNGNDTIESLKTCFKLVHPHWGRSFVVTVISLLLVVAGMILGFKIIFLSLHFAGLSDTVGKAIEATLSGQGSVSDNMIENIILSIIALLGAIIMPLQVCFLTALYHDLILRAGKPLTASRQQQPPSDKGGSFMA